MIDPLYEGREQTYVKHFILRQYLERFARIIGRRWETINYVDCFSGPWHSEAPDLRDTSFAIAVETFREVIAELREKEGRSLTVRCFFLEKKLNSFQRLATYAQSIADISIEPKRGELENSVRDILDFVEAGGRRAFSFFFIDPTGWSGFAMDSIRPLLQVRPGEVLINFMTDYIKRFVEAPEEQTKESFEIMFGEDVRPALQGLDGQEREEKLVGLYMRSLKRAGKFDFVCAAMVFKPEVESTYFHLIYATRNVRGVEKFKEVEKGAMEAMKEIRAEAKRRKQGEEQMLLLPTAQVHPSHRLVELRERYRRRAIDRVERRLDRAGKALYDELWRIVMAFPLVWESDLKEWFATGVAKGKIRPEGFVPRQTVPRLGSDNFVVRVK